MTTKRTANDVKVVSDKQEHFFGLDGDNMGHEVEDALLDNDIAASQSLDKKIKGAFAEIEEYVAELGGKVIFNGGDNMLFTADGNPKEIAEHARTIYREHTDHSATCGVGREPVEAHKALVVGKNTGKDAVIIWSGDQEGVYNDIKAKQEALESCEEEVREDSDLELGSSPALKYRAEAAQRHYQRLRGVGYEHKAALAFVDTLYKLSTSYRDELQKRSKNPMKGHSPAEVYLRDGEEAWASLVDNGFRPSASTAVEPIELTPVVGQKVVTVTDMGRVAFVGSRFVSMEWLQSGKRERVALSKFRELVAQEKAIVLPQVRTARRQTSALRS